MIQYDAQQFRYWKERPCMISLRKITLENRRLIFMIDKQYQNRGYGRKAMIAMHFISIGPAF